MKKRILSLILAAAMCAGIPAGCGNAAPSTTAASEATAATSAAATTTTAAAETSAATETTTAAPAERIVKDSAGTEVTVPAVVNTVMTFGSCGVINTLIETLGCGSLLANNMSPRFWTWEYQYKFAPQMTDAPCYENASGEIDVESVLLAEPDLCIVMWLPARHTPPVIKR